MSNKYGVVFILLCSFIQPLYSQDNWELLIPSPTSNQMVSLYFVDAERGWSVGEYGTILKTTNGGHSWRIIEVPWLNDLLDVYFPSAAVGYIVGTDGHILKTADGGEHWAIQDVHYSNNLHRVRFRNESLGWIIGEKGLILNTTNGGANWQQQISNCRENLLGIDFIDRTSICVVGQNNAILVTKDNGLNWQVVESIDTGGSYEDVYFINENIGWIGGHFNWDNLLKTTDGGFHWEEQEVEKAYYQDLSFGSEIGGAIFPVQQIFFKSDQLTGICLKKPSDHMGTFPLNTVDGGKNWFGTIDGSSEPAYYKGRFCNLSENSWISTGFQGDFLFSDDDGQAWYYPNQQKRFWQSFIVGNNGKLLVRRYREVSREADEGIQEFFRSDDFGESWHKFQPQLFNSSGDQIEVPRWFNLGSFINTRDTLWTEVYNSMVDEHSVYVSGDLGLTWHQKRAGFAFYYGKFLTPDTLIYYHISRVEVAPDVSVPELTVQYSFDGGVTFDEKNFRDIWNEIRQPEIFQYKGVNDSYFFDGHTGFLVGYDGNIIKTTDTGRSWTSIQSGVVEELWDIEFLDRNTGFVVGEFGRILKTEDGGQTWRKTNSGTQEIIYSIAFRNEREGWVGTENSLRYTTDGGETWEGVPLRYAHGLIRNIQFDGSGNGYAYTLPGFSPSLDFLFERSMSYMYLLRLKSEDTGILIEPEIDSIPEMMTLHQNYPNPFNAVTEIKYRLPAADHVSLKIYNLQGQLVRTLVDEIKPSGDHSVVWNGLSDDGEVIASGIYLYQLQTRQEVKSKSLLLLK